MKFLNRTEIAQHIIDHLFTQRKQAANAELCAYRGEGQTSCAVGCLIKDEFYTPAIEGLSVRSLLGTCDFVDPESIETLRKALIGSGVDADDRDTITMLRDFQGMHDNAYEWDSSVDLHDHLFSVTSVLAQHDVEVDLTKVKELIVQVEQTEL